MALDRLSGPNWEQFEQLSSAFLASEYPSLRTMASPSGDGGRDSELFSDGAEPTTAIQYSVAADWTAKIRQTVRRLKQTFPAVNTLIYMTNQVIGAQADDLRKELRRAGVFLDVCDRSWFLDRANADRNRESAAETLAKKFVDPLLPTTDFDRDMVAGLDDAEARTALLFLEVQVQDTDRSLGLTKASYDTLTLAALRDTSTEKRLNRHEVYARVQGFLPTHPAAQVCMKVDASLRRLMQKSIRHRKDQDEFHLLDSEIARVANSVARIDGLRRDFENDLTDVLKTAANITVVNLDAFVSAARRVLETYFLRKGEDFARAAVDAVAHNVDETTLKGIVTEVASSDIGIRGRPSTEVLLSVITTLIATPSKATEAYLRLLLESYTLFAFLAATPDVQKATRTMFGSGEIWLDTSVLLPALAEAALPDGRHPFAEMFKQARKAGLKLYVTQGVLVEIERHINRSKTYVRSPNWTGDAPFLVSAYVLAGKVKGGFISWTERFVGEADPVQDIADYLRATHDIVLESAEDHSRVPIELADAIRAEWQEVHTSRRSTSDYNQLQLAAHDSEVYLHVLSSRMSQHGKSPLGFTDWWLTLDSKARVIMDRIEPSLRPVVKIGPVLSIDYLIRYLALGPSRDKVDVTGAALAKVYAETLVEPIPEKLMALMNELREQHAELPEIVVQRRIRDTLNHERSRSGHLDAGGLINPEDVLDNAY